MARKKKDSNLERRTLEQKEVSERVKDYLIRAHSFQEMGTEVLEDKDYDVLHFPHLFFAAGVIMAIYGYFIILVSSDTDYSTFQDGLIILIIGNIIATFGMLRLLRKYWSEFFILLTISIGLIIGMMAIWFYALFPIAENEGFITSGVTEEGTFWERTSLVILTTSTFAYTACFVWYLFARFTSSLYYRFFSTTKSRASRFFIVDPWRKTLSNKGALIADILERVYWPFFFLLAVIMTLSATGDLYFIEVSWNNYFEAVLLTYLLLCAMVILFPAFWLLDYVRYYNEGRLEVRSLGQRVLILVKGYAGFGTIITFINRIGENAGFLGAILEFYMMAMFLIPSLILLIGGYVLLTERDVYYIADKIIHGDRVIVDYKLIDSKGEELKWWLALEEKLKRRG
ncbi:MAG: hypothetical protein ACTSR8_20235 [Promethearchaeota archaeon]